jgi:hypothetical protein
MARSKLRVVSGVVARGGDVPRSGRDDTVNLMALTSRVRMGRAMSSDINLVRYARYATGVSVASSGPLAPQIFVSFRAPFWTPDDYLRSIEPRIAIVLGCMRWKSAQSHEVRR